MIQEIALSWIPSLEVDVLELNLGKLTYTASKLKDELQYELISGIVHELPEHLQFLWCKVVQMVAKFGVILL